MQMRAGRHAVRLKPLQQCGVVVRNAVHYKFPVIYIG